MKAKVVKPYGNFKKGDTISKMHPSTFAALEKKGLLKLVKEESKTGDEPDDFFNPKKKA